MIPVTPPDGADWSLEPRPTPSGIELVLQIPEMGLALSLKTERADARKLADGILAAAGDGTMRTFPHPAVDEA